MRKYYFSFLSFLFFLATKLYAQDDSKSLEGSRGGTGVAEGTRGGTDQHPQIGGFDIYALLIGIVIGIIIGYFIFNQMNKSKK